MVTASVGERVLPTNGYGIRAQKASDRKTTDGFQGVLDRQTTDEREFGAKEAVKKTGFTGAKRSERVALAAKENLAKEPLDKSLTESEEGLQRAAEVLMTELAAMFGLEKESVVQGLEDLGLQAQDLLTTQGMRETVLHLCSVRENADVLTDGQWYDTLRDILNLREAAVAELEGTTGEKLEDLLKQWSEQDISEETGEGVPAPEEAVAESEEGFGGQVEGRAKESETIMGDEPAGNTDRPEERMKETGDSAKPSFGETAMLEPGGVFRNEGFAEAIPESEQIPEAHSTREIMNEILDFMKTSVKPEETTLNMQLHPESLGTLQIQLTSKGGAVTAQFLAQNETVREVLETQMVTLKQNLEEQGIKVEAVEVMVETHGFEQSFENQQRSFDREQKPEGRQIRRLRLNEEITEEQLEQLTAEDRVAAQVMLDNGTTVDYMA